MLRAIIAAVMLAAASAFGFSLEFDGSTQYAETPVAVVTAYPFSISAWVRTSASAVQAVAGVVDSSDSAQWQYMYIDANGKVVAYSRSSGDARAVGTSTVNDGEWHHAVCVFSSSSQRDVYVDGAWEAENTTLRGFASGIDLTSVGRFSDATPSGYFVGQIADPVRIYSYALTAGEVASLYWRDARRLNYTVATNQLSSLPSMSWPSSNIGGTNVLTTINLRPPQVPTDAAIVDVWDSSLSGNHGTLMPSRATGPAWSASATDANGITRYGVYDFGTIDTVYIRKGDGGGLLNGTNYTVVARVKADKTAMDANAAGGFIMADRNPTGSLNDWQLTYEKTTGWTMIVFNAAGSISTVSTVAKVDSEWRHICATVDSGSSLLSMYIDGVLSATNALSVIPNNGSPDFAISRWDQDANAAIKYHGLIDEVQVYPYSVLSSNQVYNLNLDKMPTNTPVLNMQFDSKPYEWHTHDGAHTITAYPEGASGPILRSE